MMAGTSASSVVSVTAKHYIGPASVVLPSCATVRTCLQKVQYHPDLAWQTVFKRHGAAEHDMHSKAWHGKAWQLYAAQHAQEYERTRKAHLSRHSGADGI